jgi:Fe-Mn family superoxide dismutase
VYDQLYSGRLLNVTVDEHQYGAIWGVIPLISLDVFEHAYYHKDGPKRAAYIDNFINGLHWGRINDRYKKFVK